MEARWGLTPLVSFRLLSSSCIQAGAIETRHFVNNATTIIVMRVPGRRRSVAFFITLGACLVVLTVALNVGWVLLNWRQVALLIFGIIFFIAIIAGLVLNTTFLVREIRRNEQQDSFLNAVTHELRTPLASIRLHLETLQTRDIDEQKRREFHSVMLEDCDRLLHTVEQVLHAGQIGDRKQLLNPSQLVDVGDLVRSCIDLTRRRYHLPVEAVQYAESFNGEGRGMVIGDEEELRAAVSNLLDNAAKYSKDEVRIAVEVTTLDVPDGKHVAVRIADQGVGIPSGELKRVFKRFYRVPGQTMRRVKGTGLGLFIVQSIIKKHGGRVFVESAGEGRGSTFTIQLPGVGER